MKVILDLDKVKIEYWDRLSALLMAKVNDEDIVDVLKHQNDFILEASESAKKESQ